MMVKGKRLSPGLLLTIAVFGLQVPYTAVAGSEKTTTVANPPINILDGRSFAGELVAHGESSGPSDSFVFANGKFHSEACLNWGFDPGPYWVWVESGHVHFRARLTSDENGVMTYRGIVDGPRIEARVEWVRPRWYWTMEKTFSFSGSSNKDAPDGR